MLPATDFTRLVGCRLPIQQAGMGSVSTPQLAAAVAREGGLGMIGAAGLEPREVREQVRIATELGGAGARVGVNFLVPFLDLAAFDAAAACASVVECFYGDPDPSLVARVHDGGALAAWQVGSRDEALAAVAAGYDLVVVQGVEAGGHVRSHEPLLDLLDQTRPVITVPLVAAGGIGSGKAMAAALLAGADAVRIGTRLAATTEADVHPTYRDLLVRAAADETTITEAFSMGWPNAPHRVLRTAAEAVDDPPDRRSPVPPTRSFTGDVHGAALYAGTSVGDVNAITSAPAAIRTLVAECTAALAAAKTREAR